MYEKIIYTLILIMLAMLTLTDLKYRQVNIVWLVAVGCISCLIRIIGHLDLWTSCMGVIVGAIIFVIAKVTRETIGYGDATVILCLGISMGAMKCMLILTIAVFLISIAGLVLIVAKRVKRNTRWPMMPWLLTAFMIGVSVW